MVEDDDILLSLLPENGQCMVNSSKIHTSGSLIGHFAGKTVNDVGIGRHLSAAVGILGCWFPLRSLLSRHWQALKGH